MSPPSMSAGSHPGANVGPLNSDVLTWTAAGVTPLRRTWSARALSRAAPRSQGFWPGAAASALWLGIGALAATGTTPGLAVTAGGGGGTWALAPRSLALSNAAAATTAATITSRPTPTTTWVDLRH